MLNAHLFVVLAVSVSLVKSAERGTPCTTPNRESATCISYFDCNVIKDAIATRNISAINFAKESQCGFDTQPLVCCGSTGFPKPSVPKPPNKKQPINFSSVSSNSLPDRTLCGLERAVFRVVGGTTTTIGQFPWMALIRYQNESGADAGFKCGGTLINNRFVLTAAHCILTEPDRFHPNVVRLGEWKISTLVDCEYMGEECSDPPVDVQIEKEIPHPYYSEMSGNNDIGLLRLERDVPYTDFIRPICLPPPNLSTPSLETIMTVCGWGALEQADSLSDVKKIIQIPLVSSDLCIEKLSSSTHISENQICAGGVEGKDACQGDSGGPLMRTYLDDGLQWYQEGVVARGQGCGKKNIPAVYTRVTRYVNWIIGNIESD